MKIFRIVVLIAIVVALAMLIASLAKHPVNGAEWIVLGSFLVAGYAAWKLQI